MRSIQRQSLSSRSSIASPLAFSDSGMKPSWSLSAKLQMRSNSPSRFSLDSRCSPPLERIGEAGDDKVSTSCFGSYSRHERYFGSRTPLSMMESNFGEDNNKRFLDMMYCRAPTPVEKKSNKNDTTENNNEITAIDQNIQPTQATPSKEQKIKSSIGGFTLKSESTGSIKSSSKTELEKTSKKRLCSINKNPASDASSSSPAKGKKLSSTKEKTVNTKKSTLTPSGTPSKTKESNKTPEATPQRKPSLCSTPQSSASPSPNAKKNSSITEKGSTSCRKRLMERSYSRDSMHTSPLVDSHRSSCVSRSSIPKSGDSSRLERRSVRSSSSSSSVTSLRSPSVSTRDLQRSSKSEEKGLSFFKSALRQRESRRSADLGKSALLTKKASERTCKQNGQAKEIDCDDQKTGEAGSSKTSKETLGGESNSDKQESSKPPSSLSRTLLGKSKSSSSDVSSKSRTDGKKPLEKMASSRKLSSSMQSPARTTQRPQ